MKNYKYLIIGNGIAGLSAAKEIRSKDAEASIGIISNEPYYTYFRVKLTELLCKDDFCNEDILVNSEEWYEKNNIEVLLNTVAKNLDSDNNEITLENDEKIKYEKLLIATGSRPFVPPMNGSAKKGFFALRSYNDLNDMRSYLETCNDVAVIGGGLLGLEAVWSLKELGKTVHVLQHTDYLLENQLDTQLSARLRKELEAEGIIVHTLANVEEIAGGDKVEKIILKDGREIEVQAILASTGVRPNMDLVVDTKVETNRGIVVDCSLKTSVDNIYAAGDVIELDGIVLGLWTAGLEQGKIAGCNMTGGDMCYDVPKAFASLNIGPISLFSAGKTSDCDKVYEYENGDNHYKIFTQDGLMVGSILYGDTKPMGKYRKAVFAKENVENFLKENELEDLYK